MSSTPSVIKICYHTMDPCIGRIFADQTVAGWFHWTCNYTACSFVAIASETDRIRSHLQDDHQVTTSVQCWRVNAHGDILRPVGFIPTLVDRAENMWPAEFQVVQRKREASAATNSSGASSNGEEPAPIVFYLWDRKFGWMGHHPAGMRMWNCGKPGCAFSTLATRVRMIQYHVWTHFRFYTTPDLRQATVKGDQWVA